MLVPGGPPCGWPEGLRCRRADLPETAGDLHAVRCPPIHRPPFNRGGNRGADGSRNQFPNVSWNAPHVHLSATHRPSAQTLTLKRISVLPDPTPNSSYGMNSDTSRYTVES